AYPMADVLNWKPGDTVDLMLEEDAPATVLCSGVAMFRGAMGKKQNGSTAVRITEDLNQAKGLSDDVGRD
ncbi:flagellar motor switch protein FliM, partial [Thioclava sp. BHET1]